MAIKIGSKVKVIDDSLHKDMPYWYPKLGTIGIVVRHGSCDGFFVDWG